MPQLYLGKFLLMLLPTVFAVTALLLVRRRIAHPILFFVVSVFTFCWIGDTALTFASKYLVPSPPHDADSLRHGLILTLCVADLFAGAIGGFVVWRLALALRVR